MGRETKSKGSVEGTHRPSPPVWIIVIWSFLTLFNPLLREVLGHLWLSTLVGAVIAVGLLLLGRMWIPRTEVSPQGLRIIGTVAGHAGGLLGQGARGRLRAPVARHGRVVEGGVATATALPSGHVKD